MFFGVIEIGWINYVWMFFGKKYVFFIGYSDIDEINLILSWVNCYW